jgi:dTDP-4-amino-4,6-dideoxygalactose transaminase
MRFTIDEDLTSVGRVLERFSPFAPIALSTLAGIPQELTICREAVAAAAGLRHSVLATSPRAAIAFALSAIEVGPGSEVIVPAFGGEDAAAAVENMGATPVPAEIDESGTIDRTDVERRISSRTRLLLPVHLEGSPCDLAGLYRTADSLEIEVLEYAQNGLGGSYRGVPFGTSSELGIVSFGGLSGSWPREIAAVLTSSAERRLRVEAEAQNDLGITAVEAAILNRRISLVGDAIARLRWIKQTLYEEIDGPGGARLAQCHDLQGDCGRVAILVGETAKLAERLIDALEGRDVPAVPMASLRSAVGCNNGPPALPQTRDVLARSVVIPIDLDWSDDDVRRVLRSTNEAIRSASYRME